MNIPAEMRRRPPDRTLRWIESVVGPRARVRRIRRLRNAWASAVHAVDVDDDGRRHRLVVRRWVRRDLPPDAGVVENEAAALEMLAAHSSLPVPRLVAADAHGRAADVPALAMTRLRGRDVLSPADLTAFVDGLAEMLRAIHTVAAPEGVLQPYRPWGLDTVTRPPPWSRRPNVWERAIEIAHRPVPAHTNVFVHRDFHPGNVLWQRGRITGIVDWTHACRGPAAVDIAHCRGNLALLFGMDAADEFARRYGPIDDLAWYDIADAVSFGTGDTAPEVWRWHDAGRTDITSDHEIATHDAFLAAAIARWP